MANSHHKVLLTFIGLQAPMVLDVEVRECAMDVSAHLLTRLCGPKHADDWKLWEGVLRRAIVSVELGIEFCRSCLIVVNTI